MSDEVERQLPEAPASAKPLSRVREIHLETALDLFDLLTPATSPFTHRIFRGQARAEWDLVPAVFRDGIPWLLPQPGYPSDTRTYGSQVRAEIELLWLFVARANEAGLLLPGDSEALRRYLDEVRDPVWTLSRHNLRSWPPQKLIPWLALAQHHGVPTRLLDWTYAPFTAMYFAAEGACRERDAAARMAVWMCSLNDRDRSSISGAPSVEIERPSNAYNPNLRAQRGCLMVWRKGMSREQPFERQGLQLLLAQEANRARVQRPFIFTKLTLPCAEAANVLQLLSLHHVDGATLFPGFEGVAKVVRERQYWRGYAESLGSDMPTELNQRALAVAKRLEHFLAPGEELREWQRLADTRPTEIGELIASWQEMLAAGDYFPDAKAFSPTIREFASSQELSPWEQQAIRELLTELVEATSPEPSDE